MTHALLLPWQWTDNTILYKSNSASSSIDSVDNAKIRTSVNTSAPFTYDNTPEALTSTENTKLTEAMGLWELYANVDFQEAGASTPEAVFRKDNRVEAFDIKTQSWVAVLGAAKPVTASGIQTGVDVVYHSDQFSGQLGSTGFNTIFHELGHVLGLRDGAQPGLPEYYTNRQNTVMAYEGVIPWTPMIYDIQALHERYGEKAYRDTSTNYDSSIIDGSNKLWTIWDSGGTADFINLAWHTAATQVYVDLRGGVDINGNARLSQVDQESFAIAFDSGNASGVVDIEKLTGGGGDDILIGGYVANEINGGLGADVIYGQEGNDSLYGGGGNDTIVAQIKDGPTIENTGNDSIEGGAGADIIEGGTGNDTILGGDDADVISDLGGNDSIDGGAGNEVLDGGADQDTVLGGAGNDVIHGDGDATADLLVGGDGDDVIYLGAGDTADGGAGNDTIILMDDGSTAWSYIMESAGSDKVIVVNPFTARGTIAEGDDAGDTLWFGDQDLTSWYIGGMFEGWEHFGYNLPEGFVIYQGDWGDNLALYSSTSPGYLSFWYTFDWQTSIDSPTLSSVDNYTGSEVSAGTSGADTMTGGSSADVISGGAGDDSLSGAGGNDRISAGMGSDFVSGSTGDDVLQSDDQNDTVGGADTVSGGDGNDFIETGAGNDSINAGEGRDTARAGTGNDTLRGYGGDDWFDGGDGDDLFYGGVNNDTLNGGAGVDTINGDEGNDVLEGKAGNDRLYGDDGNDAAYGDDGNDKAYGGTGLDRLYGWTGNDSLYGEGDADLLVGDAGLDSLDGGVGNDTIYGGDDADTIIGGDDNDQLFADAGDDTVAGGNGNDLIYGWTGNDTVDGQAGNDTISGEDGNDSLTGYTGDDVLFGGGGNDSLLGASGNDYSEGGDGNDYISSYNDNDTIIGGGGQDTLTSGTGNDIFIFKAVSDSYDNGTTLVLDKITDFTVDSDKIDVSLLGYTGIQAGYGSGTTLGFVYSSASDRTYVSAANSDFKFYLSGNYTLDADDFTFA